MPTTLLGSSAHTTQTPKAYRLNARTWAKKFSARLLEPGIVSYEDSGCGLALLKKETIDRCINSFVGRPVVIKHKKATPGNMKAIGHGYVTNVSYNNSDGWWYGEGVVDTDESVEAIQRAGFGSVGYTVKSTKPGGEYHAIKYHEEITDFSGEHLAIVDNPRYEGATIKLNSKKPKTHMFKLFKKSATRDNAVDDAAAKAATDKLAADKAAADAAKSKENSLQPEELSPETQIEVSADETVTIAQLVDAHNARKNGEDISPDDEVMVDDKPVKLNDLIGAYKEKLNAKSVEAKEPSKAKPGPGFYRLTNARHQPTLATEPKVTSSSTSKLARGEERYGKK